MRQDEAGDTGSDDQTDNREQSKLREADEARIVRERALGKQEGEL